ncbi:MAG: General stress protein CTC [bacterium ADurb.Bin400]|nr:MAG: General stress protein CTC [bacterium ADurb.Bin400]
MNAYNLTAKDRAESGSKTRQSGNVPAIMYGKGFEPKRISIDKTGFARLFREAGTSNLVDLSIDGEKPVKTLIQDVQYHPITLDVIHVDFLKVNMKEKIQTEIPLEFVGESKAVIEAEGVLITSKDAVEVECLPADLVPEIKVDISVLEDFEAVIRVYDIKTPAGIEILDEPEAVVAHIEPPRSEAEIEALSEEIVEDVSAVEVESEKKEESEEEESAK